jgi:allantoicase
MKRDEGMKMGRGWWMVRKEEARRRGGESLWWSLATGRFRHVSAMLVDGSVFGVEHPRASHIQYSCYEGGGGVET